MTAPDPWPQERGRPEELRDFLQAHPETEILELLLPDINGILRGKRINRREFDALYREGMKVCASTPLVDSRGEIAFETGIGTKDGDPDIMSYPVAGTLAPVPWLASPAAQALVSLYDLDGAPGSFDPRHVARRAAAKLAVAGLHPVAATEFEFYLLEPGDGAVPQPKLGKIPGTGLKQEGLQYGAMEDLWERDAFLMDLQRHCDMQKVPATAALSEFSPGQFEINLHHVKDPVTACDHGAMLKRLVKGTALKHDLGAAFMAKPFAGESGSGLHVHVSLLDEAGENVFAGPAGASRPALSQTLRHAIGGLQQTMADAMAIFAPNANSYRRLQPRSFAPLSPSWGYNHRAVALRVPVCDSKNTRIEHRVAGADANPYLVMAALLAGIHHGIANRCEPTEMVAEGAMIDEQEATLPRRWEAALDRFKRSEILPEYLGEEFCRVFEIMRRNECERFHEQVGNLDYEWYLRSV